ncbi:hypothetical protein SLEP1_g36422 [Rubroshorea leprosula]|uniref:Uncharacterized protein n=1 Tax=Rubroshorea leprosula TaxID=152421 RepID=A0AAV5KRF9_9ROSI|nr:hypothetical protein SLEP1_g36422 [Rubroshorea leprosula]
MSVNLLSLKVASVIHLPTWIKATSMRRLPITDKKHISTKKPEQYHRRFFLVTHVGKLPTKITSPSTAVPLKVCYVANSPRKKLYENFNLPTRLTSGMKKAIFHLAAYR